jgi:hypothetical protein
MILHIFRSWAYLAKLKLIKVIDCALYCNTVQRVICKVYSKLGMINSVIWKTRGKLNVIHTKIEYLT